ncbi:MAG: hypothetical protein CMF04_16165 [Hyphomonas sp.]|jgi:hypothetical protein|nr:hypothetical protein [Hyphomonas sp.]
MAALRLDLDLHRQGACLSELKCQWATRPIMNARMRHRAATTRTFLDNLDFIASIFSSWNSCLASHQA